jgi:hypothetical protein
LPPNFLNALSRVPAQLPSGTFLVSSALESQKVLKAPPTLFPPHYSSSQQECSLQEKHLGAVTANLPFIVSSAPEAPVVSQPERPPPQKSGKSHNGNLSGGSHLDVRRQNTQIKSTGKSPIAADILARMDIPNRSHPHPPRPPLLSQQSNSVPSTPHQHAKEFHGSSSRSPSPNLGLGLGSHSPRSVKSEANGPLPSLPRILGRATCKYETMSTFSKRRMQYDIGDAPLEKPKEEPKKTLDPHEEKKLSGDMRELYDRLLPSKESDQKRMMFKEKLDTILHKEWPGNEFLVHIFGSSGNMLCTDESDGKVKGTISLWTMLIPRYSRCLYSDALHRTGNYPRSGR